MCVRGRGRLCDVCGVHEKSLECCRSTVCEASAQPREAVALILALGRSGSSIERRVWAGGGSCACCCARACGRQNHRDSTAHIPLTKDLPPSTKGASRGWHSAAIPLQGSVRPWVWMPSQRVQSPKDRESTTSSGTCTTHWISPHLHKGPAPSIDRECHITRGHPLPLLH